MDIEWKEGAVCFADGEQWFVNTGAESEKYQLANLKCDRQYSFYGMSGFSKDFQLNTIKKGDFIAASKLDTEQKYNDAVEVFELFGFIECTSYTGLFEFLLIDCNGEVCSCSRGYPEAKRKLTYQQIMAIGELKRLEIEKSAPKIAPDLTPDLTPDLVQNPSHYQFFEGVEVIEIIAGSMTLEQFKGYCLGNRIKYRLRAGNKDKLEQEIAKSDKYVELYDEHKHLCK